MKVHHHHHHHHQEHRHHQDKDHPNKVGVGLLAKKHLAAQLSVSLQRGNPQHPFAHILCGHLQTQRFLFFSSMWQSTLTLCPIPAFAYLQTQSLHFRKLELNVHCVLTIVTATSHWAKKVARQLFNGAQCCLIVTITKQVLSKIKRNHKEEDFRPRCKKDQ